MVFLVYLQFFSLKEHDHFLRIMEGMFRANGGCGYVKKPDILLNVGQNNEVFDPSGTRPIKKTLQVKGMCTSTHM